MYLKTLDAVLEAAKARQVDLLPAAANTPNRQEFLLFSSPHLVFPGVIIVRNDVRGNLGLKDLYGKRVAIVSGYVWQELIKSDHPAVQIVPAPDLTAALQMASLGSVDAVVEAMPVVIDVIGKAGIGNLRVAGETGFFTRLSFATRKDWPLLSSVIEKTLAEISPDERRSIFDKWIHLKADSAAGFPWRTFWSVVVSLGACAALFAVGAVLWIRSLRHQVRVRTAILDHQAAQLGESEERLRDFAEASSDWFWEMNERLIMTYMSPNFTTVTGIDVAQLLGKDCDQFIAAVCGKVSIEEHKRHLREHLPYREFQFEIAIPGHASVVVSTSGRPAFDANGRFIGFRGTANDITEKRKLEQAVAVAEARAHQAQKMEAIDQMTGGIAHDFNNLLQAILGNADFLETANPPGSQGHLAAQQIRLAGERAARLTKHLLAFARQQPLEPAPIDLGEVVDSLRPLLQRVLGESVALRCELPTTPMLAVADRAQVESALVNLALNARDAMPVGGTFTITVDAGEFAVAAGAATKTTPSACARMRVSDTGTGMSAAVQERAFEPFFTTKEVGKGTGLGLSMVGFAEQSGRRRTGGRLDTAPRSPSCCRWPKRSQDEVLPAAAGTPSAAGAATIPSGGTFTAVRAQVAMSIRSLGYEVIEVATAPPR